MPQILLYTFISISAIQVIYWLMLLIVHAKQKTELKSESTGVNPVSIVVCAYNELENLKLLIPILLKQNHKNFEVIIVNDRSDDGTYDYLNAEKEKHLHLQVVNVDKVHDHINSKKYAITLGVKAAKNDLLLFTDADCKPNSEDWANEMSNGAEENTNFILGYSPYEKHSGFLNALIRFETRLTGILYTAFAMMGMPYMGVGRNLMYRKSLFMKNNGFNMHQNVTGGDDDLFVNQFALGKETKVVIGANKLTWSIPKLTWKTYFYQKKRHLSVGKLYKFKDRLLLGLYSLTHVLFWLFIVIMGVNKFFPETLAGILIFRILLVSLVIGITSKKFGEPMNIWTIPAFDFIYSFYIIFAGTIAIFTKKVTWR
jgi:glycosyltransferase involved in cell wall biosynthesis